MSIFEWILHVIVFGWYRPIYIDPILFFIINPVLLFFILKFVFKNKLVNSILFSLSAQFFSFLFFLLAAMSYQYIMEFMEVKQLVFVNPINPLYAIISWILWSIMAQSIFFILIGLSLKKRVWPFIAATCMSNIITGFIVIYFF